MNKNEISEKMNKDVSELETDELVGLLASFNVAYRSGDPIVSDPVYDHIYLAELKNRYPNGDHPYLQTVESEPEAAFAGSARVEHPIPMLSTDKAYTADEVAAYVRRVEKAAGEIGEPIENLQYLATPKIDGMAARQLNGQLVTRGESKLNAGFDISKVFEFGVCAAYEPSGTPSVVGELACSREYFSEFLSGEFADERAIVVGLASSAAQGGEPSPLALQAARDGAIKIVVYSELSGISVDGKTLVSNIDTIFSELTADFDYLTDGIVVEVKNKNVREHMGHNGSFHRWQIAKKVKGEMKEAKVIDILWQTAKTGRVTPVLQVTKTTIGGRVISSPTGHHARHIIENGFGVGAKVMVHFAGGVISAVDHAIMPVTPEIPKYCTCCGAELEWLETSQKDEKPRFLICPNTAGCSAQIENAIIHFFKIMGNADLFGPATVKKINEADIRLPEIFDLHTDDFMAIGFGPGQAQNLRRQTERCRTEAVDDYKFLGAFGLHTLGRGIARRILEQHHLEDLWKVDIDDLVKIELIAEKKANIIVKGLSEQWPIINEMISKIGFNLTRTQLASEKETIDSPIAGKGVVFTGAMASGSRSEMQEKARSLDAKVQSSVSKNTSYLVCGEKVGQVKMNKAKAVGVKVITEDEYLAMIG